MLFKKVMAIISIALMASCSVGTANTKFGKINGQINTLFGDKTIKKGFESAKDFFADKKADDSEKDDSEKDDSEE